VAARHGRWPGRIFGLRVLESGKESRSSRKKMLLRERTKGFIANKGVTARKAQKTNLKLVRKRLNEPKKEANEASF